MNMKGKVEIRKDSKALERWKRTWNIGKKQQILKRKTKKGIWYNLCVTWSKFEEKLKKGDKINLGIFQYVSIPFGIKNAAKFLQRMMDIDFSKEAREAWFPINIDDLVIFHDNWSDHIRAIELVILKCQDFDMTISIKKFKFGTMKWNKRGWKVDE